VLDERIMGGARALPQLEALVRATTAGGFRRPFPFELCYMPRCGTTRLEQLRCLQAP
jgi:hypothetical protein